MKYTQREVLQFVEENDVKFVKLMFCDVFGNLKAISLLANELPSVFKNGYSFDAFDMDGLMNVCDGDLVLKPVLDTLSLLPWRPQQGRVMRLFCSIYRSDGKPFEGDGRHYLYKAVDRAKKQGLDFKIGTSCEFYVFELDEKGLPTKIPHDMAGCCGVAPEDRGENLRRDICMTLEQMEINPSSSKHESGPGQNEIDFNSDSPINAADNLITFKNTVKSVSGRNGLYASFMPKPLPDKSGSSLQIFISCTRNGEKVFRSDGEPSPCAKAMIAGLMQNLPAMTLFLNGITNSYSRLEAIPSMHNSTWTYSNLNLPVRLNNDMLVVRTPDNTCNPYFALGLIINSCLDGMENKYALPQTVNIDMPYAVPEGCAKIPLSLEQAVSCAENSEFIKNTFNEKMLTFMLAKKKAMCGDFEQAQDKEIYETVKYFYTL